MIDPGIGFVALFDDKGTRLVMMKRDGNAMTGTVEAPGKPKSFEAYDLDGEKIRSGSVGLVGSGTDLVMDTIAIRAPMQVWLKEFLVVGFG